MKNSHIFAAMLAFATMSTSTLAADMVTEPVVDWSGLYLGAHAGYLWGDVDVDGFDDSDIEGFIWGALGGTTSSQTTLFLASKPILELVMPKDLISAALT